MIRCKAECGAWEHFSFSDFFVSFKTKISIVSHGCEKNEETFRVYLFSALSRYFKFWRSSNDDSIKLRWSITRFWSRQNRKTFKTPKISSFCSRIHIFMECDDDNWTKTRLNWRSWRKRYKVRKNFMQNIQKQFPHTIIGPLIGCF